MEKEKRFITKSFYSRRQMRISDEVLDELKRLKKGTWNHFLKTLLDNYKKDGKHNS